MIEITIKVHWISLLQINQEEHTKIYWIPNIKIYKITICLLKFTWNAYLKGYQL